MARACCVQEMAFDRNCAALNMADVINRAHRGRRLAAVAAALCRWAGMLRPFTAKRHFDATLIEMVPSLAQQNFLM